MNKHVKPTDNAATDLSRRSFLVGTAATGLVLGYAGLADSALAAAAPASFEPSVWYAIAPDGLVTVTCGKADMGQHIASTMAQIVCEELGAKWSDMRVQLASNDPKFNDPVLGAAVILFSGASLLALRAYRRTHSDFPYWYGMALALMASTGICAVAGSPRRNCSAWIPPMPGRLMSIRITSGRWMRAISIPCLPSPAHNRRISGRRAMSCSTSCMFAWLSSTYSRVRGTAPCWTCA